jgi:hypothetical protein
MSRVSARGGATFADSLTTCTDERFSTSIVAGAGGDDVWCACTGPFTARFGGGLDFEAGLATFFLGFGARVFGFFARGAATTLISVPRVLTPRSNSAVASFEKKLGVDGPFERVFCADGAGSEGFGSAAFAFRLASGSAAAATSTAAATISID